MALTKKPRPLKDRSERWLLTYADLITLLMVFFVIMYSLSTINVKKFLDLKGSLTEAFHVGVLSGISSQGLNQELSGESVQQQISAANDSAKQSVASQVQKIAEATGNDNAILVMQTPEGVDVSLAAELLFQSGTADLKPGATQLLKMITAPLKALDNPVHVIANTDDLPPRQTNSAFKDNWQLGNARAYSVLRALVDKTGFPQSRLVLFNNASFKPLFPNDTAEDRAKNRRIDLLIVFPNSDIQPASGPLPNA